MTIIKEESLRFFEFWSGGKDRAQQLTGEELDTIERILEELYPDGMSETAINDLFWFDKDTIAKWLGYNSFEDITSRDDNEKAC